MSSFTLLLLFAVIFSFAEGGFIGTSHHRLEKDGRRRVLEAHEDYPFEADTYSFTGIVEGVGFVEHSHDVVVHNHTAFFEDWEASLDFSRASCTPRPLLSFSPFGEQSEQPLLPGEDVAITEAPPLTFLAPLAGATVGAAARAVERRFTSARFVVLGGAAARAEGCPLLLPEKRSPIYAVWAVRVVRNALELDLRPAALLDVFASARWSHKIEPDIDAALARRGESRAMYTSAKRPARDLASGSFVFGYNQNAAGTSYNNELGPIFSQASGFNVQLYRTFVGFSGTYNIDLNFVAWKYVDVWVPAGCCCWSWWTGSFGCWDGFWLGRAGVGPIGFGVSQADQNAAAQRNSGGFRLSLDATLVVDINLGLGIQLSRDPIAPTNSSGAFVLSQGESLLPGMSLTSTNGLYTARFQTDGNFVLYSGSNTKLWESNTQTTTRLTMQTDGNLVMYNARGLPVWASNTNGRGGPGPYSLTLQNDRNLVIYDSENNGLWSTNTQISGTTNLNVGASIQLPKFDLWSLVKSLDFIIFGVPVRIQSVGSVGFSLTSTGNVLRDFSVRGGVVFPTLRWTGILHYDNQGGGFSASSKFSVDLEKARSSFDILRKGTIFMDPGSTIELDAYFKRGYNLYGGVLQWDDVLGHLYTINWNEKATSTLPCSTGSTPFLVTSTPYHKKVISALRVRDIISNTLDGYLPFGWPTLISQLVPYAFLFSADVFAFYFPVYPIPGISGCMAKSPFRYEPKAFLGAVVDSVMTLNPNGCFSPVCYANAYPDLINAFGSGATLSSAARLSRHWLGSGTREKRNPCCRVQWLGSRRLSSSDSVQWEADATAREEASLLALLPPPGRRAQQAQSYIFDLQNGTLYAQDPRLRAALPLPPMPYTSWTVASDGTIQSASTPRPVDVSAAVTTSVFGPSIIPQGPVVNFDLAPDATQAAVLFVPNATLEATLFVYQEPTSCGSSSVQPSDLSVTAAVSASGLSSTTLLARNSTSWRIGAAADNGFKAVYLQQQALLSSPSGAFYYFNITCKNKCARCKGYVAAQWENPPTFGLEANWTVGFSAALQLPPLPPNATAPAFVAALTAAVAAISGVQTNSVSINMTGSLVNVNVTSTVMARGNMDIGSTGRLTATGRVSHDDACNFGMDGARGAGAAFLGAVRGLNANATPFASQNLLQCATLTLPLLYKQLCDPTYNVTENVASGAPINSSSTLAVPLTFSAILTSVSDALQAYGGVPSTSLQNLSDGNVTVHAAPVAFMSLVSSRLFVASAEPPKFPSDISPSPPPAAAAPAFDVSTINAIIGGVVSGSVLVLLLLIAYCYYRKPLKALSPAGRPPANETVNVAHSNRASLLWRGAALLTLARARGGAPPSTPLGAAVDAHAGEGPPPAAQGGRATEDTASAVGGLASGAARFCGGEGALASESPPLAAPVEAPSVAGGAPITADSALPLGWFKRGPDAEGNFWYDHPSTQFSSWDPPAQLAAEARKVAAAMWKNGAGDLPPEWDYGQTATGTYFFIKPNKETTQADPREAFEEYATCFEAAAMRGVDVSAWQALAS